jgi:hypothetical protein
MNGDAKPEGTIDFELQSLGLSDMQIYKIKAAHHESGTGSSYCPHLLWDFKWTKHDTWSAREGNQSPPALPHCG